MTTDHALATAFRFRLYVAGDTPNSMQALANLHAFCRECLLERHEIEVVDVFARPEEALREGVFMTPLLVKLSPLPEKRIIGTLGSKQVLTQALGIPRESD